MQCCPDPEQCSSMAESLVKAVVQSFLGHLHCLFSSIDITDSAASLTEVGENKPISNKKDF